MVTFEEVTEVRRRDGVTTGVKQVAWISSLIFFLIMFDAPKENRLQGKMPVRSEYASVCVCTVHESTPLQSQLVMTLTNPVAGIDHGRR